MRQFIKKHSVLLIFIIFLVIILIENHFVWLYHDDYGYASLSYLPGFTGCKEMNCSIKDILSFLKFHYNNWGGRILYFFIEILLLRGGLKLFHIVQSIITMFIFYLIYKIASRNKNNIYLAIVTVLCYGLIEMGVLRSGVFWATAVVLYLFPMLPFLLFVYIYKPNIKIWKKILCLILIFISCFSQEQVGVLCISYVGLYFLYDIIKNKKINISNLIMLISGGVGFLLLILSPGTKVRESMSPSFYNLGLISKLKLTIPDILGNIFGQYNRLFTFFLLVTCSYYSYLVIKNKIGNKKINMIYFFSNLIVLFGQIINSNGYFSYLYYLFNNNLYRNVVIIISVLQVILLFIPMIKYFYHHNLNVFNYLIVGAVLSQFAMALSPYYPLRSILMFMYIFFIIFVYTFNCIKDINIKKSIIIVLFVFEALNTIRIIAGYKENYYIHKYNDSVMKKVSLQIKKGKKIEKINLKKVPDTWYGSDEPYIIERQKIEKYMRHYYDLPKSIKFKYHN